MLGARAIHVDAEAQVLAGLERIQLALQQQCIRTEIYEPLAGDELAGDVRDLRMEERFPAGDAHHRRAALVGGADAVLDREVFLQDRRGILDLPASRAGEVAAEKRLQHQHQGISLSAGQALSQYVSSDRHHLCYGNRHSSALVLPDRVAGEQAIHSMLQRHPFRRALLQPHDHKMLERR